MNRVFGGAGAARAWRRAAAPGALRRAGRHVALVALCGFAWLSAPAAALAASAQAQLQSFVASVHAATGEFQQSRSGNGAGAARAQSGRFAFQRPGKFRWQVTKPYAQLVVSDGKHVFQYDPDLDQVTERSAGQAVGASPAALLFGSGTLEDTFTLQGLPDRDGMQWLRATPKSTGAGFTHVDIGFAGGLPSQLALLDAFGQTTSITLSGFQTNPSIAADQFQFTVPKGAALVKMNE